LYEAGFGTSNRLDRKGIIGITQPRRVAVLATSKRVSYELGLKLGKEVGFQVRYDKKIGDNCSIKFMTDGILLREVQVVIFYLDMFPICSFYGVLLSSL
jgi:ATP-dependent RNA helicase DHX37/DHR1